MISTKSNRDTRFSIRATAKQKELIERAATRTNKTISQFVLENSIEAAEALDLDNASFALNKKNYKAFLAALDESPRSVPALRKLLTDPSVIDDPRD